MRGADTMQERLFTMARLEDFVPADHPLRAIQGMVNEALKRLNGLFNEMYADHGRASIAPEKLIRALLLQVLYSVRSERLLVEQLHYNLLFRWFVGLAIDDAVWDHSSFSKNRDRLLDHAVIEAFFTELIKAWASHKSFQPKDEPPADGGCRMQCRGQLARPAAQQRHPRIDHRPRSAALQEEQHSRGDPVLSGPRPDRERQRAGRQRQGECGQWVRRARERPGDARRAARDQTPDRWRRQGLRQRRVHCPSA
jgi:transposase